MPEELDADVEVISTTPAEDSSDSDSSSGSNTNSGNGSEDSSADVILTDVVGEDGYRKTQSQLEEDVASGNTDNLDPAPQSSQSAVEGSVENINEQAGTDREAPTQRERNRQTFLEDISTTTQGERQADVNLSGVQTQDGAQLTEEELRNRIEQGRTENLEAGPGARTSQSAKRQSRRNRRQNILQERQKDRQQTNAKPVGEQILNNNDNLTEKGRDFVKDKQEARELPTTAYSVVFDKFREEGAKGGVDYLLNQTSNTVDELVEGDIQGAIDAGSTKTVAGEFVGESILGQAAEADKTLIDSLQQDPESSKVNILGQQLDFEGVNVVEEKGEPIQKFQNTLPETQVFGERLGQAGGDAGRFIVKESGLGAGLEAIGNQADNTGNILPEETENRIEEIQSDLAEGAIREPFKSSKQLGLINETESQAGQKLALAGSDFAVNQLEDFASNAFNNPEQTGENIGRFIGEEAAEDTAGLFTLIGGAGARSVREGPQPIIEETSSGSAILARQAAKNPEDVGKEFAGELILGGLGGKGLVSNSKTETFVDTDSQTIIEENPLTGSGRSERQEIVRSERERRRQDPRLQVEQRVDFMQSPENRGNNPTPRKKVLELLNIQEGDFSGAFGGSDNPSKYLDTETPVTRRERLKKDLLDLEKLKSKTPTFNPEIRDKLDFNAFQKLKERRRDGFDFLGGSENPERFVGESPEFSLVEELKGTALRDPVVIGTRDSGPADFQEEAQEQFDPLTQQGFLPELPLDREREPRSRTGYTADALLGKAKEKNQRTTELLEQLNEDLPGKSRKGSLGAGRGQEVILKEPESETDTDSLVDNSVDLNDRVQDDRLRQGRSLFDRSSEDVFITNRDRSSSKDSSRSGFTSIPGLDQGLGVSQDQGTETGFDEGLDEFLGEEQDTDQGSTQQGSPELASRQLFTDDFRDDNLFQQESSRRSTGRRLIDLDLEDDSESSSSTGLLGDQQDLGLRRSLAADILGVSGSTTAEEAESTDAAQQGTSRFQNPFSLRAFEDSNGNSEDLF